MPRTREEGRQGSQPLLQVPGSPPPQVLLPLPPAQGAQAHLVPPSARIFAICYKCNKYIFNLIQLFTDDPLLEYRPGTIGPIRTGLRMPDPITPSLWEYGGFRLQIHLWEGRDIHYANFQGIWMKDSIRLPCPTQVL